METRSVSPVFVGRADELAVLNDALGRAAAGEPQALLVGGEAGVGKTRLVEEFLTTARRSRAAVAVGGCVEIGADGLPFAPFSTALRALRRGLPEEFAAAAAGQEAELARLLPELGDTGAGKHDEEGMARLFELTVRLLERLAAERTVVVALEDLHWADASTRHLLTYLLRTLRTGRLVVVCTYRADDVHRRHPLRPLLAELDRMRTVRRLELARFTPDEVRRQMAGILATEPEQALVDTIFDRSDGNAFFVEELAVARSQGCRTGLTDTLRDLLLVRVETLPEHAQKVVRIVAEGGSTVEYGLLEAVARLAEDDLIEALRAAVGANILLTTDDGDGYRFRHSLVREAVSDDLLPGERSRLNRRYAEALEADPTLARTDECVTRLASYWYYAHDPAKALPAVLLAAAEARRRHAYSEQLRLLERAMELWEAVPEEVRSALRPLDSAETYCGCDPATTPLSLLDLMADACTAGRYCGERESALKISRRALRILDEDPHPLRAAWFWAQRSQLVSALGRGDGWDEISKAQELVKGLPPSAVHADVLVKAAGWGMIHSPGPDALAAAERAVEYARMVGADELELHARLTYGGLLSDAGDVETGLAEMYAVREKVLEHGMAEMLHRSHVNLPSCLEGVGRSAEAVAIAQEGIELSRTYGLLDTEAWIWGNLGDSLHSLGRWDEAAEAARQAQRCAQSDRPRAGAAARFAMLAVARGDTAEAAAQLAVARRYYGTHDHQPQYVIPMAFLSVSIAAAEGRVLDGREILRSTVETGFPPGTQRYAWPMLLEAAVMEADARGLPTAEPGRAEAVERIRTAARRLATSLPIWTGYENWVRAELLRAEGRDTPAHWEEAAAAFEPLGRPYGLARIGHRWAEAILYSDDAGREQAASLIQSAHATAEKLGARPLVDALALLAQRARLPLVRPARPEAVPDAPVDPARELGLTGRERDVLRLVAEGRSNRQIAETLFISPKTASVHVSNILAKLGVAGRGEAAALAHRLHLVPLGTQATA